MTETRDAINQDPNGGYTASQDKPSPQPPTQDDNQSVIKGGSPPVKRSSK